MWKYESESPSVMSDSLQPHGLYSPGNSPGQNTGVGIPSLLQGIFPTQGSNPGLLHCRQILYQLSYRGSPHESMKRHNSCSEEEQGLMLGLHLQSCAFSSSGLPSGCVGREHSRRPHGSRNARTVMPEREKGMVKETNRALLTHHLCVPKFALPGEDWWGLFTNIQSEMSPWGFALGPPEGMHVLHTWPTQGLPLTLGAVSSSVVLPVFRQSLNDNFRENEPPSSVRHSGPNRHQNKYNVQTLFSKSKR